MNEHGIRNLVIVGGGTAGWMAAAAFSRFFNDGMMRITLIESEEIGTVGVGEATIPPLITFNRMLGINENEFLRETQGTIKLGIEFVNWGAIGERYFHPFGFHGKDIEGIHFHQLYLAERARRPMPDIAHWSMSAVAAAQRKFGRPAQGAPSPVSDLLYAFHFDASLYAAFLRRYAEARGVQRLEGHVTDVKLRAEDGFVEAVKLADGRAVAGDMFIDCSGFRGLLIEGAFHTGYEDWHHWLPCNRAIAVSNAHPGDPDPFTRATAHGAGWQWRIPLQHRTGSGFVYASEHMEDDAAETLLLANLDGEPLSTPRRLSFVAGRRKQTWNRNVVSLGLASGFIEPLESTGIHIIQAGIARLIALFPDRRFNPVERDEYNRQMRRLYEEIRDFIVLHYAATTRTDTDFWNRCRTMTVPDSLREKVALFRAKGRVFRDHLELFGTTSWVAVALGQHVVPEEPEPAVHGLDPDKVRIALEQMRKTYLEVAQHLPSHGDFLRQCGRPDPAPSAETASAAPATPFFSFEAESPIPLDKGLPI